MATTTTNSESPSTCIISSGINQHNCSSQSVPPPNLATICIAANLVSQPNRVQPGSLKPTATGTSPEMKSPSPIFRWLWQIVKSNFPVASTSGARVRPIDSYRILNGSLHELLGAVSHGRNVLCDSCKAEMHYDKKLVIYNAYQALTLNFH